MSEEFFNNPFTSYFASSLPEEFFNNPFISYFAALQSFYLIRNEKFDYYLSLENSKLLFFYSESSQSQINYCLFKEVFLIVFSYFLNY